MKNGLIKLVFNPNIESFLRRDKLFKEASLEELCELYNIYLKSDSNLSDVIIKVLNIEKCSRDDLRYILKNVLESKLKLSVFTKKIQDVKSRVVKCDYVKVFDDLGLLYDEAPNDLLRKIAYVDIENLSIVNKDCELSFMIFTYNRNLSGNTIKALTDIYKFSKVNGLDLNLKIKSLVFVYNELYNNDYPAILNDVLDSINKILSGIDTYVSKSLLLQCIDFNTDLGFQLKMESLGLHV